MNDELNLYLSLLEIGDKVGVYEGGEEDALTEVTSIATNYIQVMRYPSLKFDRHTGNQVPNRKGARTYRHLMSVQEWQRRTTEADYRSELLRLIDRATITKECYEKCRAALEEIL